jgi:uncharacterized protein (TIGR00297 family)
MEFLTLDVKGVVLAVILLVLFLVFGGGLGYFFVLTMFAFLVLSALATYTGAKYKKKLGVGQAPRGFWNVVANGSPPLIVAAFFYYFTITHNPTGVLLAVIGFGASVASITADKFNSEIGVLNGKPRMIFTMKKVKRGVSGGVTLLGLVAGLVGAFLVAALIMIVLGPLSLLKSTYTFGIRKAILAISIGGFIGSLVDSAFGYFEEKGVGNKFTTNFLCGIVGSIAAIIIFVLI